MPSCGDVTTVPGTAGGERQCRSRRDERPVPVKAWGRGEQCAGSPAHVTLHREQGKRERQACCARRERTRVGMHKGHERAEKSRTKRFMRAWQLVPFLLK